MNRFRLHTKVDGAPRKVRGVRQWIVVDEWCVMFARAPALELAQALAKSRGTQARSLSPDDSARLGEYAVVRFSGSEWSYALRGANECPLFEAYEELEKASQLLSEELHLLALEDTSNSVVHRSFRDGSQTLRQDWMDSSKVVIKASKDMEALGIELPLLWYESEAFLAGVREPDAIAVFG